MNGSQFQARIRLFLGLRFGSTLVGPTASAKQPPRRSSQAMEADMPKYLINRELLHEPWGRLTRYKTTQSFHQHRHP